MKEKLKSKVKGVGKGKAPAKPMSVKDKLKAKKPYQHDIISCADGTAPISEVEKSINK